MSSVNPEVLRLIRNKRQDKFSYDFTVNGVKVIGAIKVGAKAQNYLINIPAALDICVYKKNVDGSFSQIYLYWRWLAAWLPKEMFIVLPFHRSHPTYLRENWRELLDPTRHDMDLHNRRLELFYPIWKYPK
jgi:hypothetical protein